MWPRRPGVRIPSLTPSTQESPAVVPVLLSSFADRPYHAHNRLIASFTTAPDGRREVARAVAKKLAAAASPVAFILPAGGIQEWDQAGEPLHEPEALDAFLDEMRKAIPASVALEEVDTHINTPEFAAKALEIFDRWVAEGVVPRGRA